MVIEDHREHDRIDLQTRTRIWLKEPYRGKNVEFEGFADTHNLSIAGTFLESTYLLPVGFPVNLEIFLDTDQVLVARGEVIHRLPDERDGGPGMGIGFTAVDLPNRELLLRYFVNERIRDFYTERVLKEFPHLQDRLSLQDIALVVNLWEDREGRLTALKARADAKTP